MANTFISPSWVTTDTAVNFKNSMKLIGLFNREYDAQWSNLPDGAKIGYTVQARLPQIFQTIEGQALVVQPIINQTVPISINHQYQTAMDWSSIQSALEVEFVQSRYTVPAGISQANKWDAAAGLEVYKQVYNSIGAPGVSLGNNQTWTDGIALLHNLGVPEETYAVLDPIAQSQLLNANFALFGKQYQDYFKSGQFSEQALGISEWYYDPNMPMHTTGTFTSSTPVASSGGQTGTSLTTSGWGTYALKAGDVFTIDGVQTTNPQSFVNVGSLQQFTLSADVAGSSTATLTFTPSIIPSGSQQTVNASPANNAALTFIGATGSVSATMATQTSKQSLMFNPDAFAFVMADLPSPLPGAQSSRKSDKETGISMRWVEQYNIQTDQLPRRVDSIGGIAVVRPQFAVRAWR